MLFQNKGVNPSTSRQDGKEGGEETKEEESKTEDFRFLDTMVKGSSFWHLVCD